MSLNTSCTLNIAGKNSNDTYTLNVPSNLLGFCRYDFSRFLEECSRLCRECMKSGEYPLDRIVALRNSIIGCHRYVENNIRTVFDKIVVDCWIEYICRQGEITVTALWNSLIGCEDPFQNAIFQRLTEYRTHRAINQWINILKIQEYAKKKIDFIFGGKLSSPDEASVRLNFFDLMFSVAANEQGYSLENIGSVRMCKPGRTAGAPFVYGGVSKEIVKNLFKDVQFADSQPYVSREEGAMSDWEAMDAFAVIKNYLPSHNDSVAKIILKSLTKIPDNVFAPSSFKAMIDLEIDTVINMGGYLQKCAKCGEYFLKNERYTSDYCDTVRRDGSTCRELMEADAPEPLDEKELLLFNEKAEKLYHKMAEKVNFEISQRDFAEWSGNFDVMRNNVISGRATDSDFDDFVEYSEQLANQKMSRAKQNMLATVQEEMIRPDGTRAQVKPYQFARIDRRELEKQGMLKPSNQEERLPPISEEKKAAEKPVPPVAKIIRGASPTSYHEIPVQSTRTEKEAVIPIKSDVFVGEDFSKPTQNNASAAPAEQRAASSPQEIILRMAEQERVRRQNEEGGQPVTSGRVSRNEGNPSQKANRPRLPDLDEYPVEDAFAQDAFVKDTFVEDIPVKNSSEEIFSANKEENTVPEYAGQKNPRSSADEYGSGSDNAEALSVNASGSSLRESGKTETNAINSESGLTETRIGNDDSRKSDESYHSRSEQVRRQWEQRSDVEFHAEEPVKSQAPRIKLPEFEEDKKDKDNFVTLVDNRGRAERIEEELNSLKKEVDKTEHSETEKAVKSSSSKAAKVAGAYRTVAQMPVLDKQEKTESEADAADDFAKILSNIERNDGFDEEALPLDADGMPLSHKTKHVMDALMRNSSVSPSLIYGRRQAAEKNVIIDEDYIEKNGKKPSDKK